MNIQINTSNLLHQLLSDNKYAMEHMEINFRRFSEKEYNKKYLQLEEIERDIQVLFRIRKLMMECNFEYNYMRFVQTLHNYSKKWSKVYTGINVDLSHEANARKM